MDEKSAPLQIRSCNKTPILFGGETASLSVEESENFGLEQCIGHLSEHATGKAFRESAAGSSEPEIDSLRSVVSRLFPLQS